MESVFAYQLMENIFVSCLKLALQLIFKLSSSFFTTVSLLGLGYLTLKLCAGYKNYKFNSKKAIN